MPWENGGFALVRLDTAIEWARDEQGAFGEGGERAVATLRGSGIAEVHGVFFAMSSADVSPSSKLSNWVQSALTAVTPEAVIQVPIPSRKLFGKGWQEPCIHRFGFAHAGGAYTAWEIEIMGAAVRLSSPTRPARRFSAEDRTATGASTRIPVIAAFWDALDETALPQV